MKKFEKFLQGHHKIGDLGQDTFSIMGCSISCGTSNSVVLNQKEKMNELCTNRPLAAAGYKCASEVAMPSDVTSFKSIIGQILFIGRVLHPPFLFHASKMASKTPTLKIHHLKDIAALVTRRKRTVPLLLYNGRFTPSEPWELVAFSDAAFCGKTEIGGRAGFIIFRIQKDIEHPISWSARKLRRVARSSATAELLREADETSQLLYLKNVVSEIFNTPDKPTTRLVLDSRCLFRLSTNTNAP